MDQITPALIAASVALIIVWISTRQARNLEISKHREELASEAFSDLLHAMAKSALREESLILFAYAKARLVAYGGASLAMNVLRYERAQREHAQSGGVSDEAQAAIVAIAQDIRSANGVMGTLSDSDIRELVFGPSRQSPSLPTP